MYTPVNPSSTVWKWGKNYIGMFCWWLMYNLCGVCVWWVGGVPGGGGRGGISFVTKPVFLDSVGGSFCGAFNVHALATDGDGGLVKQHTKT